MAGCIAIVMALDIVTTNYIIGNGGIEANAFMVPVVKSLPMFILVKYGVCAIIFAMALYTERAVKIGSSNVIFSVVYLVSCLPVVSNTLVIARVIP